LALQLRALLADGAKCDRGVESHVIGALISSLRAFEAAGGCRHVQCRWGRGLGEEYPCIKERGLDDEWRRKWCMSNVTRLGFVEEACRGHSMHDTLELLFRNARNVRDILQRDAATQRDARQHLKPTQPLQASQQLILGMRS
jgi:hypothetical protein